MIKEIDRIDYPDIDKFVYSHTFEINGGLPGLRCQYQGWTIDEKEKLIDALVRKFRNDLIKYIEHPQYKIVKFL